MPSKDLRFTDNVPSYVSHSGARVSPPARYHAESLAPLPDLHSTIHPSIDCYPHPLVLWDMVEAPQYAHMAPGPYTNLGDAATNPPLPFMDITFSSLPLKIRVNALNGVFVTVNDVLNCIYATLREPLTEQDLALFCPSREAQREVIKNFKQRCASKGAYSQVEMAKGTKRIDCMGTATKFGGLKERKVEYGNPHAFDLRVVS